MNTPPIDRRTFLRTAAGVTAATVTTAPATAAVPTGRAKSCIFLMLTGGPSQLDTWDPKPNAPSDIRGPFSPIRTTVPGLHLSELFPKMAAMADNFSLIRTMHHEYAPIHENGFQLLNTGRRFGDGVEWPWVGSTLRSHRRDRGDNLVLKVIPSLETNTGVAISNGLNPGDDDRVWVWGGNEGKYFARPGSVFARFGNTIFGQNCGWAALANKLIPSSFIVVNAYSTVFDCLSWDCHADTGALHTTLSDYRNEVAPTFDTAFTTLLARLEETGRLDETLVVAVGEFGRTPKLNCNGGRDHWANCWTAIVAGGGVQGGRVIGESDTITSEPKDRPVSCPELVATIYHAMGIPSATLIPSPDGLPVRVVEAEPVRELF
ncbi:DUF1501 domain-containing protein [Limnoglobus roseus]|uniref:DUF1501 domain-containing protein n=1 Tax=Limnoglobus roseus TaxID=2598579 RepID=UPI00143D0184|nr:DUF1501 domain-containing protein [Limnoglobus roseus]